MAGVLSLNGTFTQPIEIVKTLTVNDKAFFKKSTVTGTGEVTDIGVSEGNGTKAIGQYSHAEGYLTESLGYYAHAEGEETSAVGTASFAGGRHSRAKDSYTFTWSGVMSKNVPYESNGEGTFNINPNDVTGSGKPENGLYIGNINFPNHIRNYAIKFINANPNTFTSLNTFKNGITSERGAVQIVSGTFSTSSGVETTFNGPTKVVTQDENDVSTLVASTAFVKSRTDKCLPISGGTMSGKLILNSEPEEDLQAATKKYVDDSKTIVTVDNSEQRSGKQIATLTINGAEANIFTPKVVAGQNVSVQENESDGTVKISCNPDITITGGTMKVPIGTIIPYCGNNTPDGFLYCDGRAVSRTTYSELFSVIGTTFGSGNGTTTFNLPKLDDGRFLEGSNANGSYHSAGLPNIRGSTLSNDGNGIAYSPYATGKKGEQDDIYSSGAFFIAPPDSYEHSYTISGIDDYNTDRADGALGFDASRSNSIYSDSVATVQPKSLTVRYFIKYTKTTEEKSVLSVNNILPDSTGNVNFYGLRERYEYTPLINWSYPNPTTCCDGSSVNWFNTSTGVNYRSIYNDGRYATYIVPLKEDFTNYDKIMIIPVDYSYDGSPDLEFSPIETDIFDFMLSLPKTSGFVDSINTPGAGYANFSILWTPYCGSYNYNFSQASKSTRNRLVFYSNYHGYGIQEIYGLKRVWQ